MGLPACLPRHLERDLQRRKGKKGGDSRLHLTWAAAAKPVVEVAHLEPRRKFFFERGPLGGGGGGADVASMPLGRQTWMLLRENELMRTDGRAVTTGQVRRPRSTRARGRAYTCRRRSDPSNPPNVSGECDLALLLGHNLLFCSPPPKTRTQDTARPPGPSDWTPQGPTGLAGEANITAIDPGCLLTRRSFWDRGS